MTIKEFKKLSIEEQKEFFRPRTKEELTIEYINYLCDNLFNVSINGKFYTACKMCGACYFKYGKHPKQAKMYKELENTIETIQIEGLAEPWFLK